MPANCCVPHCFTNSKDYLLLSFHSFPKDKKRCKQWDELVRNDNLPSVPKVCSLHFEGGVKTYNSVPTIFPRLPIWPEVVLEYNKKVEIWLQPFEQDHSYTRAPRLLRCAVQAAQTKRNTRTSRGLVPKIENNTQPPEDEPSTSADIEPAEPESIIVSLEVAEDEELDRGAMVDVPSDLPANKGETMIPYYQSTHLLMKDELQSILFSLQCHLDENPPDSDASLKKLLTTVVKLLANMTELYDTSVELNTFNRFLLRKFAGSDEDIQVWTGFYSYTALICFYEGVLLPHVAGMRFWGSTNSSDVKDRCGPKRSLEPIDELFLTLVKLRQGSSNADLAERFRISSASVSRIFLSYIKLMSFLLQQIPIWISHSKIKKYMPDAFKPLYKDVVTIVDCTEFQIERPSDLELQSVSYSEYKGHCTAKALIGLSPSGTPNFISDLMEGSVSDNSITMTSGILDKMVKGDAMMADRGWTNKVALAKHGVRLVTPHFLRDKKQMDLPQLTESVCLARLRIHVERCIGRMKQWQILSRKLHLSEWMALNDIFKVCAHLILFWPPICGKDA